MKWYISGPMRGHKHFNFPAFREAEEYLRSLDAEDEVFNPARHDAETLGMGWEPDETQAITAEQLHSWMRKDLSEVASAEAIVLLPGWEHSEGARREASVAYWCGLRLYEYEADAPRGYRLRAPVAENVAAVLTGPPPKPATVSPVPAPAKTVRTNEQNEVLGIFLNLLALPTGDGGAKRGRGEKPSWKADTSHVAAAYRHLDPSRERYDEDSGAHKYVHAAWRLLAVAYQEMAEDGLIPGDPE